MCACDIWCMYAMWPFVCFHPQAKSERNYHIFYEMLAGLPPNEKRSLYLQEAETYYYLNQVLREKYEVHSAKHIHTKSTDEEWSL